ncbi:MAG: hypothetical protein ACRD68_04720, partial [Pyrinomonadaceae bacterium]
MKNSDSRKDAPSLLRGSRVVLPRGVAEGVSVFLEGGRVTRIAEGRGGAAGGGAGGPLDLDGLTLLPGFIDVHIHGAVGVDTMEADADALHRVALFLARHGVTAWLPTLVPAPDEDYARAVSAIGQLMREQDERPAAARAVGVHYEGPFVNGAQCGALRTAYFRTFGGPADVDTLPTVDVEAAVHMITV